MCVEFELRVRGGGLRQCEAQDAELLPSRHVACMQTGEILAPLSVVLAAVLVVQYAVPNTESVLDGAHVAIAVGVVYFAVTVHLVELPVTLVALTIGEAALALTVFMALEPLSLVDLRAAVQEMKASQRLISSRTSTMVWRSSP